MSEIEPGDWVQCVIDAEVWGQGRKLKHQTRHEGRPVKRGQAYKVREVIRGLCADGSECRGLRFVGIKAFNENGIEGGWPAEGFRVLEDDLN